MSKTLVVTSGGLDSACALLYCLARGEKCETIIFGYAQKHEIETQYARYFANHFNVGWHFTDLRVLSNQLWDESVLAGYVDTDIPEGPYNGRAITEVAFRNGTFASIATAYAMKKGFDKIVMGMHKEGTTVPYPDCTEEFAKEMDEAIKAGTGGKVTLEVPYIKLTKKQLVAVACTYPEPYRLTQELVDLTYSCYRGGEKPCHNCATCIERDAALKASGLQ